MHEIHSYDLFDTCLLRTVAFPTDVFYTVALELLKRIPLLASVLSLEDFHACRIRAEGLARINSGKEEVTLRDIWTEMSRLFSYDVTDTGCGIELDAERQHITVNTDVLTLIASSRRSRAHIVYISDTYLPQSFLFELLREYGLFLPGDRLFVSSEVGATKATGNLYRHILTTERLRPVQIFHLGDNQHSDVAVPKSLGISAQHYSKTIPTRSEVAVLCSARTHKTSSSQLAGYSRIFRLAEHNASPSEVSLVASFLGPFLLTFVSWALQSAQRDEVKRLYFLSRDCYLMSRVASVLGPSYGIDTRYLRVSRQALLLPSIKEISSLGIPWLRRSFESATLGTLLAKLDLSGSVVEDLCLHAFRASDTTYPLKSDTDWKQLWDTLNTPPAKETLTSKVAERREAAVSYFTEQGLFEDVPWGIVDLGWHLVCQSSLKRMIGSSTMRGYYLGLNVTRVGPLEAGASRSLFYNSPGDWSTVVAPACIFSRATLLEHILGIAPHGTVHHYEITGATTQVIGPPLSGRMPLLSDRLGALLEEYASGADDTMVRALGDVLTAQDLLETLTHTFFASPDGELLEALSGISMATDQNNLDERPLFHPYSWRDYFQMLGDRAGLGFSPLQRGHAWKEASRLVSPRSIRAAYGCTQLLESILHRSIGILRYSAPSH